MTNAFGHVPLTIKPGTTFAGVASEAGPGSQLNRNQISHFYIEPQNKGNPPAWQHFLADAGIGKTAERDFRCRLGLTKVITVSISKPQTYIFGLPMLCCQCRRVRIHTDLKVVSGISPVSISGFQTLKWMVLSMAVLLGLAATVQGRLAAQSTPAPGDVSAAVRESGSAGDGAAPSPVVTDAPITVAAYYYPGMHPDPRWDKNKYPGFTEWDEIKAAKPRFPGHIQPKIPTWGYQNEAKPEVMAQKIAAAADYGVNVFIFDWYYYNDGPYLDDALDEGFLHATNQARVKFALMWANHDWYDIQGYNPANNNLKLLYPGKVTPVTWDKICDLVIARYFRQPNYWRLDGKPYFSIYEMSQFLDSFGSIENARAALDQFRAKVRAAGFPGLHVNAIVWGEPNLPGGKTPPGWPKLCHDLALDSLTSYTWVHHGALNNDTFPVSDYLWGRQKYLSFWARAQTDYSIPYFPNATINWDNSPRAAAGADWSRPAAPVVNSVITGNTPAAFQQSLAFIKARLLALPTQPKIITINAWNEWPEGSCLEPAQQYGYGYLEAVKAVFGQP
jgi:hypothetical protein